MRCVISHHTVYVYSKPVFLEPHVIRLRPRCDPGQNVLACDIAVTPEPTGSSCGLDAEGNAFKQCWFNDEIRKLEIRTWAEVETCRENPFDFLPESGALRLPLDLSSAVAASLAPSLQRAHIIEEGRPDHVSDLAQSLLAQAKNETIEFCTLLNGYLFSSMSKVERPEPGIQTPEESLKLLSGSCRDLTVLFLEAARCVGLPARFVSGYFWPAKCCHENTKHELHAWAEVYISGGGWRGFDPTQGLATADRHVALAAAASPALAAPVSGTFRGTGAGSTLHHEVEFRCHEE